MIIRTLDFETTGFPAHEKPSGLIQIGWTDVELAEGGEFPTSISVGEPVQFLCDPRIANPKLSIDIGALATHHIIEADLDGAPAPDSIIARMVEGCDAFACHNKEHDGYYFTGGDKPFICTLKAARRVWPDMERHSNQYLRYALGLPIDRQLAEPPHHAGPDSYVTAHILARILKEGADLADLIEWTKLPTLFSTLPFGSAHRGKRMEDVPTSYLKWMRKEARDISKDIKFTIEHHLDLRGEL